ncbi:trypsin-like serine protease [Jannaschia seohaensis]|uniref:Putative secreted protein n=1 Tax=Jannaschia seohaensis TaxID=475081 RepID=A0A2Y9B2C2_9RHOB|nr:trypsin-like serine protease [Jannaschia seohaensis]PWJ13270.1 putative secreted protein [Jannaschia seohaensis]SSA50596.1 VPLPA-CTERM protein sorting domain-containing protein [Jannaschia seohaensis]
MKTIANLFRRVRAAAAVLVLTTSMAPAIVINSVDGIATSKALGDPFDNVVTFSLNGFSPFCTGALISTTTVLTAKHCFDTASPSALEVLFTNGAGATQASRSVSEISYMSSPPSDFYGTDLAIVRMTQAIVGYTPFKLAADLVVGEVARMVGYGANGTGDVGHQGTTDGARWAADNVVDWIGAPGGEGGTFYAAGANIISTDFDSPDGTSNTLDGGVFNSSPDAILYEGTTAPGDSGGPLLVKRNGEWTVAGILLGGTTSTSAYGDISWWTDVSHTEARNFIEAAGGEFVAAVPLPAAVWLMLAALGGLALLRRSA